MTTNTTLLPKPGAVALMVLMAATRFHHFGTPFALPDASLAVFFLAGLWLGGPYLFPILLLEAGLIDYLAITRLGVSDFCVSNAYVFLIPAYGTMWLGGRSCGKFGGTNAVGLMKQLTILAVSASTAFILSNGSFYWLSGRYPDTHWAQYLERFAMYYPPYLATALAYTVAIFASVLAVKTILARKQSRQII